MTMAKPDFFPPPLPHPFCALKRHKNIRRELLRFSQQSIPTLEKKKKKQLAKFWRDSKISTDLSDQSKLSKIKNLSSQRRTVMGEGEGGREREKKVREKKSFVTKPSFKNLSLVSLNDLFNTLFIILSNKKRNCFVITCDRKICNFGTDC